VLVAQLLLFVRFVLLYFHFYVVEHGDQQFVLLLNYVLVAPDPMQHVKVIILIDESLRMQTMIILSGGNILWEDNIISKSIFSIVGSIPIVLTLKSHDLFYPLSIDSFQIFLMEEFVYSTLFEGIVFCPLLYVLF
jgi:hypothetical protein